ncbi:DUF6544 family protein [Afifella pfennigii]|uniref:DUF6544 family protein n=1 Tax=Afifella pfennigii TaxID=209897 RepID=UPI00068CC516|nr:DUF6544 family protein [Afifella pfennigii]
MAILLGFILLVLAAVLVAQLFYRLDKREARRAWRTLAAQSEPAGTFDPAMIADLPEPARRYLSYAIAPGTPLLTTVELRMVGTFVLGEPARHRILAMEARQVLSPPHGFVWMPDIGSKIIRIWGSDGYTAGRAWTRFWLWGVIPVARLAGRGDLALSAAGRAVMEAIWAPASLLPQNGACWQRAGEDAARVSFKVAGRELVATLTLSGEGRPVGISAMRWSNANPQGAFRWQPFGGSIEETGTFDGYTIPTRIEVGNHYGTKSYFPFFRAAIVEARYRR